jgi:uncharacterized integral membrane protein
MADGDVHHVEGTGGRKLSPRQITMLVLAGVIVLFAALNFDKSDVHLLFTTVSMPLVFVIAACTLIGFAAGYLFAVHLEKKD